MRLPESLRRKSAGEIALYLFVSFIFFLVAASYVYILVWAFIAGAKTHNEVVLNPFGLPEKWLFGHYLEVFSTLEVNGFGFWGMTFNSIYFSVFGTLIGQFTTMSFAYCCTKYKFPGSNWPYTIIMIMLTLPLYGTGGSLYKIIDAFGFINSYTHIFMAIQGMNMQFLYYRAYFQNLSWSYAEAAMIDGAGDFMIYLKVMLPMAKPIFGALFLTNWLTDWNRCDSNLIYLPKIPNLPVGIYQFNTEMIYRARLDILFAACIIIVIPAIVLYTAFNKVITTNVSLGGLKG